MKKWLYLLLVFLLTSCGMFKYEAGNSRKYAFNIEISDLNTSNAKDNEDGNLSFKIVSSLCLLDSNNTISDIELNATSINLGLTNTGIIKQPKNLLDDKAKKDAYNMRLKSAIRKEWYEQIEGLEAWLVGKTVNEVSGMELESGKSKDQDLLATTTIAISAYQKAVSESFNNVK